MLACSLKLSMVGAPAKPATTLTNSNARQVLSSLPTHSVHRSAVSSRRKTTAGARAQRLVVCASAELASFTTTAATPVTTADGSPAQFPGVAGVYAVYDSAGTLQYIGLSRKINISIATHLESMPELVHAVKLLEVPDAGKEDLTDAWKQWVQEAVQETGTIPPGNAPGEKSWQQRRPRQAKPEIKLTPGKGLQDLTCSVEELIDQVVKSCGVVAFVKGTRTQPQCGFSHKVLTILSENFGTNFEVVNVLDEVYNPGLREAIKGYSQWPTIPQVFVNGEFIGGADIVEEMHGSGELKTLLK